MPLSKHFPHNVYRVHNYVLPLNLYWWLYINQLFTNVNIESTFSFFLMHLTCLMVYSVLIVLPTFLNEAIAGSFTEHDILPVSNEQLIILSNGSIKV